MKLSEIKEFLDEKVEKFNRASFIETDPVQVPWQFIQTENIEIAAFFTATLSWGNRPAIIRNARRLMQMMDNRPLEFIVQASNSDMKIFNNYAHRTFNGTDCIYFVRSLKNIYKNHGGLQRVFETGFHAGGSVKSALGYFHQVFFEVQGERTRKHVANVERGASAKRLNILSRVIRVAINQNKLIHQTSIQ